MKKLTITHGNGNSTTYQLIEDGKDLPIAYHEETPQELIQAIETARISGKRVKIYLGDTKTGKNWNEEHDITGTIGLSRGRDARYPLLIANIRSHGGGHILDHCILQFKIDGRIVYRHPLFKQSNFEMKPAREQGYSHSVFIDGTMYSNHRSERSAKLLIAKLS